MTALAPAHDGSWFSAVDATGAVRVIDAETGRSRRTLGRSGARAVAAARRLVLVGSGPGRVPPGIAARPLRREDALTLWDAGTGERVRSLVGPLGGAEHLALSADGSLAVSGFEHSAAAWDTETGVFLREFPAHGEEVGAVAAADGRRAVMTAAGESVRLWALDWDLADRPPEPSPPAEPIVWGNAFESFQLAVGAARRRRPRHWTRSWCHSAWRSWC